MIRTHKIRLNPTPDQWAFLMKAAGTARYAYNWALAQWQTATGQKPTLNDLQQQFKTAQPDWIQEVPPSAPEGALYDFAAAIQNYYEGRSSAPEFRSRNRGDFRFHLDADQFHVAGNWLRIAKLGLVNMTETLRFAGRVLNATVTCEDEAWYVAIAVDVPDTEGKQSGKQPIQPALSEHNLQNMQRTWRRYLVRLARLQRVFSRKKKGSKKQEKVRDKIARLNQHIRTLRDDLFHGFGAMAAHWMNAESLESQPTTESLGSVKSQDHLSPPTGPTQEAASLPGMTSATAKAMWEATGRWFSSGKTCPQCGQKRKKLPRGQKNGQPAVCPNCGFVFERGASAALNFLNRGLRFTHEESPSGSGYDGRKSTPSDGEHPEDDRHRSQER